MINLSKKENLKALSEYPKEVGVNIYMKLLGI